MTFRADLGTRSTKNHSLHKVNEDFENGRNAVVKPSAEPSLLALCLGKAGKSLAERLTQKQSN